ncbi:MAG: hypothetical protein JWN31_1562 [Frankiales bacterium]|nr:hypothetical protein [Frankiales bacterium]
MAMSLAAQERPDRRQLRRAQTIDEIVQVALDVMAEQGVGGLSLGEVARRIGIRPPSLYVYFDSKNALYDAVFARGWLSVTATMSRLPEPDESTDGRDYLGRASAAFVRWAIEHPVYAQLMLWRPVPGYQPSAEAYEPAVTSLALTHSQISRLQELGKLTAETPVDDLVGAWTAVITGVISRQLANAPGESFDNGSVTRLLPTLVDMYCAHFAPPTTKGQR